MNNTMYNTILKATPILINIHLFDRVIVSINDYVNFRKMDIIYLFDKKTSYENMLKYINAYTQNTLNNISDVFGNINDYMMTTHKEYISYDKGYYHELLNDNYLTQLPLLRTCYTEHHMAII